MDIVDILAEIQNLVRQGASAKQLATYGVRVVEQLTNADEQSAVGRVVLRALLDRADAGQRSIAERALEVMDKFPSYPRPRAAVVRAALKSLAQA
ncbi:MAG: hypothetical protein AMXMBFR33_54390 [Candidatus Xenobia bacterium]